MDQTLWIVWLILIVGVVALGFVGFWFSLRTLRWFTLVTAVILAIAVTRFGVTHPEYAQANLVDSFLSGVDQVAMTLLHPLWLGKVPAPGVAGRWIIAAVLLLGYRQLEGWCLRWQAPQLDLSEIGQGGHAATSAGSPAAARGRRGAATGDGLTPVQIHAKLAAELRFRLPTMEVRSPAVLPGGARTNALASIAETSGFSGSGLVSAVLRFAGMIWPAPRSVKVRSWVESANGTRITVFLEDVKTGLPIATKTVAGDCFSEAASMVAGYIARQIFAMDRTVPEWCYGTADGRDLGAMQLVRLERVYAACPKDVAESRGVQIGILNNSTGSARTAGIVRYELAQLLALQGEHVESLRLHALNRELNDRFYRGRYRLAMSLEMIANPEHHLPQTQETTDKLGEVLQILARCGLAKTPNVSAEDPEPQLSLVLLHAAAEDLRQVRAQLSLWRVVRDALVRRDERAVWLPHWRPRHRKAFHDGVCVAELLVAIRCKLLQPDAPASGWLKRVRDRRHLRRATRITALIAGKPTFINAALSHPQDTWWAEDSGKAVRRLPRERSFVSWQAAYNTACLYAALADNARAHGAPPEVRRDLEHRVIVSLRRAVEDPHSELERPSDWIDSDPDFHAISHHPKDFPAFENFLLDQMRQDYPISFTSGKCPIQHTAAVRTPAVPAGRPRRQQAPIQIPVQRPVPTWAFAAVTKIESQASPPLR